MKSFFMFLITALLFVQCGKKPGNTDDIKSFIMETSIQQAIDSLVLRHGEINKERIQKGVRGVASFWQESDGSDSVFQAYCRDHFISDSLQLEKVFLRISGHLETVNGSFNSILVGLQQPLSLDMGEVFPVDEDFGTYNPSVHFIDDFFGNKIAFFIILNFPYFQLDEKNAMADKWNRKQWAYARLGDIFDSRVPAAMNQLVVNANSRSELYITGYNIFAGKLINNEGKTLFPENMKLLSHWNLRDEIKTNYGNPQGLEKQRMLYEVMKRIITQQIPQKVINSDQYSWNPFTNKVYEHNAEITAPSEPSTRYDMLLGFFKAQQQVDQYYPRLNTYIARNFESGMKIPLQDAEELFTSYLSSPEVQKVADLIKKRLGRNLEPFDIWYDGFKARTSIPADELDRATRMKYPDPAAVQKDLPAILIKLGFPRDKALFITSKVQVDPARGSGHAWGAVSHDQKSLLRTRIFADGMDYKGYNIAVHEFGHNVEQTISLQNVDYFLLSGVPNTAFTEALAFMFQKNDLMLLGMKNTNTLQEYYNNLDNFWQLYEIMGVSMVDIQTWKWLYAHPGTTAKELNDAVNSIARDIWNKYYAAVFGTKEQPILAIYSHMINTPLYLPNYAYGHIIEFQLAEYLKNKDFAGEIERIYSQGSITPQQWMQLAVGSKISVQPVINSANEALEKIRQ
jgi:hypothetical protein